MIYTYDKIMYIYTYTCFLYMGEMYTLITLQVASDFTISSFKTLLTLIE